MISQLSITCVGIRFPNKKGGARDFEIKMCNPGDPVTLEHEPRNPADGSAIKVISSRGIQMGYVSAERTWLIHRAWQEAKVVKAIFQNAYPDGCWLRVGIDEEPVLPPMEKQGFIPDRKKPSVPPGADPDSGFWPDEIYPDE